MKEMILTAAEPVDPEPGVYEGVPWDEYASWNCFSKSMTGYALKSGEHLHQYIHGERGRSAALVFGSLVDCLLLEPEFFEERYIVQPDTYESVKLTGRAPNKVETVTEKPWNNNASTCKDFRKEVIASGKDLITIGDQDKARSIKMAVMENGEASVSVTAGKKQVSLVWIDEKTGVKCKGRIDILGDTIDDLKTARDASPDGFSRDLGNLGYHVQAGAYTEAWRTLTGEEKEFRFIVVETSGETEHPLVALYRMDTMSTIAGLLMFRRALEKVQVYQEFGVKGYSEYFEPIGAPHWMVDREINMSDEDIEL